MAKKRVKKQKGWLARLVDMDDNSISASTVFLLITSMVAIILLLVPAIVLMVEVIYNHTISTDLSGMAAYITAVAAIFASGGILKGWTNYSSYRFANAQTKEAVQKLSDAVQRKMIESIDASVKEQESIYENMDEPEVDPDGPDEEFN